MSSKTPYVFTHILSLNLEPLRLLANCHKLLDAAITVRVWLGECMRQKSRCTCGESECS